MLRYSCPTSVQAKQNVSYYELNQPTHACILRMCMHDNQHPLLRPFVRLGPPRLVAPADALEV
jgi:hypothetical protein